MHEHARAGQGPVLLDIGGEIGALIVSMPAGLRGAEIEARPAPGEPEAVPVHVGVVARPVDEQVVDCAVFPALRLGSYQLHQRPDGPVRLRVTVDGGRITRARWPG